MIDLSLLLIENRAQQWDIFIRDDFELEFFIFLFFLQVLVVLLSLLTYGFGGYYMVFCAAFVGTDVFLGAFGAFFALLFFGPMIALIFSTLLFVGVKKVSYP